MLLQVRNLSSGDSGSSPTYWLRFGCTWAQNETYKPLVVRVGDCLGAAVEES
jgi:hypothetical protein